MASSFNLAGIGLMLVLFMDEMLISFSKITPMQTSYTNYDTYGQDVVEEQPNELRFDAYYQGPSEGFEQIEWGYHDPVGPDMWPYLFADQCARRRQSPIAIVTARSVRASIPQVILFGYRTWPTKMKAFNNGHIIKFKVKGVQKVPRAMSKKSDATPYDIEDIHFHWGSHNFQGSEHTLDGKQFPAEMHIVHKLQGKTISEASLIKGGITVLGVFIDIGPEDNPAFEPLIDSLQHIIYKNNSHKFLYNYPLHSLLPSNKKEFVRYEGSLTTPMCNEVVLWTIFRNPVTLSWKQIVQLRGLHRTRFEERPPLPMTDNFRPTQPLNGRTVYRVGF